MYLIKKKVLKIEIAINIEIVLFIIIFIITKQISLYLIFILFVLIHELSHIIFGIVLGFKLKKFMIMPFGFKIQFHEKKTDKNLELKKAIVALAGPGANLIIIGIAALFKLHISVIYINLIIAIFNLLPIYPLDGGRVLKSILNIKIERSKVYKIVNKVSNLSIIVLTGLSSVLILYMKNISILFILTYLWYVVIKENKRYKMIKRVYDMMKINT